MLGSLGFFLGSGIGLNLFCDNGRVMTKVYPKMKSKRIPNTTRPPKKRPPLVRKKSFVADQKIYDDIEKCYNPMDHLAEPSLIDKITIERMIKLQRWPVPEMLIGRSKKSTFKLKIDSIIADAYKVEEMVEWSVFRLDIDVPYNTMHSDDNFRLYHSSDDESQKDKTNN